MGGSGGPGFGLCWAVERDRRVTVEVLVEVAILFIAGIVEFLPGAGAEGPDVLRVADAALPQQVLVAMTLSSGGTGKVSNSHDCLPRAICFSCLMRRVSLPRRTCRVAKPQRELADRRFLALELLLATPPPHQLMLVHVRRLQHSPQKKTAARLAQGRRCNLKPQKLELRDLR
eukprot:CAMPEP_0170209582 /NCGR_PEP_ID=MMETSP0116_2-20130129/4380_1 /TAXON_ID=400756 /ORGANISM="Durinskia baltica, Strain CSIRO CS-38" /LENGTH=172 /DNA_ID=CAMNT_0010460063 /DNA_START=67 /DNA_END=586 /DNA_ORIENTATION=-